MHQRDLPTEIIPPVTGDDGYGSSCYLLPWPAGWRRAIQFALVLVWAAELTLAAGLLRALVLVAEFWR